MQSFGQYVIMMTEYNNKNCADFVQKEPNGTIGSALLCFSQKESTSMIYTVTLNPCLDYIIDVPGFRSGRVNRVTQEKLIPGGKGINVSYALHILQEETLALGFTAGFTGQEIERLMTNHGIRHQFVRLGCGNSRIDVHMTDREESAINGLGPTASQQDLEHLVDSLQMLDHGDTLVLSGAALGGVRDTIYGDLLHCLPRDKDIQVVVDAKGPLLLNTLRYHPFLIKPNRQEIIDIFFLQPDSLDGIIHYAENLQTMGARNVLVSLSEEGAILLTENGEVYYHDAIHDGEVKNTVGCGDTMVAGFLSGYNRKHDLLDAFRLSLAAATSKAFHEGRGDYGDMMRYYEQLCAEEFKPMERKKKK